MWNKACVEFGLALMKLNTLVKTKQLLYYYNDKYIWVYALLVVHFIRYNTHKIHKQVFIYIIHIDTVLHCKDFINVILDYYISFIYETFKN